MIKRMTCLSQLKPMKCAYLRHCQQIIPLRHHRYNNQLTVIGTIRGERRLSEGMCGKQIRRTDELTHRDNSAHLRVVQYFDTKSLK